MLSMFLDPERKEILSLSALFIVEELANRGQCEGGMCRALAGSRAEPANWVCLKKATNHDHDNAKAQRSQQLE